MSPRRRDREEPEQLILPPTPAPKPRSAKILTPGQVAKAYIARRAKPSGVPGRVRLVFTLDLPCARAERLVARPIRDGVNLEAVVIEVLEAGTRDENGDAAGCCERGVGDAPAEGVCVD